MPFISFTTNKTLTLSQEKKLKEQLGEIITLLPNKTEENLMLHFEDKQIMYFRGKDTDCMKIECQLFHHLDLESKEYIMNYLQKYPGIILVISHDIPFLNKVTNKTLHLDKQKHNMELFLGSYETFQKRLEEEKKTNERIAIKQEKEEEKLKKIIAKYIRGNEKKAKLPKTVKKN